MEEKRDGNDSWTFVRLARRVDSFNYDRVTRELLNVVNEGKRFVVADLSETSFLSLPAIKFLANTAELLSTRDGELVLFSPCNRTRRHIEIFSSGSKMRICMSRAQISTEFVDSVNEEVI